MVKNKSEKILSECNVHKATWTLQIMGREESKIMIPGFRSGDNMWFLSHLPSPPLCTLLFLLSGVMLKFSSSVVFPTLFLPHSLSSLWFQLSSLFGWPLHFYLSFWSLSQPVVLHIPCLLGMLCYDHGLSVIRHLFNSSHCWEIYVILEKFLNFYKGQLPHL